MIGGSDSEDVMADARQVKVMGDRDDAQSWFDVECISFVPCRIKKTKHIIEIVCKNITTSKKLLNAPYRLQLNTADLHFCPCLCPRP